MTLAAGTRLGNLVIVAPIGSGGMGDVYRARDEKLERDVAVKVLPDDVASDSERLARFEREAKTLAALNHPGIATLYGFEHGCLVMELVEGGTLSERLARGALSLEDAVPLFRQVAEALEAAHEKGILHRDLKPANVMITADGRAKLLDFGLAKAFIAGEAEVASHAPTLTKETEPGTILGTAAYMSPEQARGGSVDRRADVWAFGCCLYEALSGRRAFAAASMTDTLAAVIRAEPDWSALPAETPSRIRALLARCLRKDPRQRLQHIGDARIVLEEDKPLEEVWTSERKTRGGAWLAVPAALLTGLIVWLFAPTGRDVEPAVTRSALSLAPTELNRGTLVSPIAVSPDGRRVAHAADEGIYLRSLDALEWHLVPGTEDAHMPFFSPDGDFVGFLLGDRLMKVAVSGGAPMLIAELIPNIRGASWGNNGKIVFTMGNRGGISEIDADGGDVITLTEPDAAKREKTHRLAHVLPGSEAVLFTLGKGDMDTWDDASIAVWSRETGEYEILIEGGSNPHYSSTEHLLYARDGAVLAVPFDAESLEVRGTPLAVVDHVATYPLYGHAEIALSREGTLVYGRGGALGGQYRVVWVDRNGNVAPLIESLRPYWQVSLSPDERSLALAIEGANISLWIYDLARGTISRFASGFANVSPVWTPNGRRIAFFKDHLGSRDIYWKSTDGSGNAELLVESNHDLSPNSWSPDGILAYQQRHPETGWDLWTRSPDGDRTSFLDSTFNERRARFSPDGQWIAYESDASGRWEIVLRTFPDSGRTWQVSTSGGTLPRWSHDGREIFYRNGDDLLAVDFEPGEDPVLGRPNLLFERPVPLFFSRDFDVASDGRFVFIDNASPIPPARELVLVQNFGAELERLLP